MPFKDLEARRAYAQKHYQENKDSYAQRNKKTRQARQQYVWEVKVNSPCVDCGLVWHPVQMQFDHTGNDKVADINHLIRTSTLEAIKKEIAKCELVCANCHMMRTWIRSREKLAPLE